MMPIQSMVPGVYMFGGPQAAPSTSTAVLPPPDADTSKCTDGLTMLLALLSKKSQTDAAAGVQNVDSAKTEREQKLHEAQVAYQKMKDAQNDPFAWVGNLFKAVVAVASAIATVATGGAAAPALTASAMAFGGVAKSTQCFGEFSNVIGDCANLVSALGTGNFAMIAGDGTSLTGSVGAETKQFDATAVTALSITGQGISSLASFAAPTGQGDVVGGQLGRDGKLVGITGSTIHQISRAVADGDGAQAAIEMKAKRMDMARIDRLIGELIDGVKDAHNSHNKAVRAVEGAVETQNQTVLAAAGVRG